MTKEKKDTGNNNLFQDVKSEEKFKSRIIELMLPRSYLEYKSIFCSLFNVTLFCLTIQGEIAL